MEIVGVGGAGVYKAENGVYYGECRDGKFNGKGVADVLHQRRKRLCKVWL